MKKYVIFMSVIIILIFCFILYLNSPKNYSLDYNLKDYNVLEKYDKKDYYYYFDITVDDITFNFVLPLKYTHHRKLIKDIEINKKDNNLCVKPLINGEDIEPICHDGSEFVDKYIAGFAEVLKTSKINEYNNVKIYDSKNTYLIWNNKGLTSLNDKNNLNFLTNESYDNLLSYQYDKYILIADYDQSRIFNKFYIYDNENKKIGEWELDYTISLESYFMGDIDGYVYLFDKKNKVQYRLDIKNKKMKITSDKDGVFMYERENKTMPISNFIYNEVKFVIENNYNFILDENKLYMRLFNSSKMIRITNKNVDSIVRIDDDTVYYLVNENLYSYKVGEGEKLLLVNFEWNFSYLNKIFIFN